VVGSDLRASWSCRTWPNRPPNREPLIRTYGSIKTLEELKALIAQAPSSRPVLVGVIHGDLHATNVLVRMNDAVIIDLERIAIGKPLVLDAASLEGGLFIDGFVGDRRSAEEVLESIFVKLLPSLTPPKRRASRWLYGELSLFGGVTSRAS